MKSVKNQHEIAISYCCVRMGSEDLSLYFPFHLSPSYHLNHKRQVTYQQILLMLWASMSEGDHLVLDWWHSYSFAYYKHCLFGKSFFNKSSKTTTTNKNAKYNDMQYEVFILISTLYWHLCWTEVTWFNTYSQPHAISYCGNVGFEWSSKWPTSVKLELWPTVARKDISQDTSF